MSAVVADAVYRPGIRYGLSFDAYNALPGIRAGHLSRMRRSPLHYIHAANHYDESTAPLTLGRIAHCAVLEPDQLDRRYRVWARRSEKTGNLCPRNGQHWESFCAEHPNQEDATQDEIAHALAMQAAVHGDELAERYLCDGKPEVTLLGEMSVDVPGNDGIPIPRSVTRQAKARPDWLHIEGRKHFLVGLKTARDAGPEAFPYSAERLGYAISWAWYHDLYKALTGIEPRMVEIVVESAAPHDVVVYEIGEDTLEAGRDGTDRDEGYRELLRRLVECERAQHFPGAGASQQQTFMLPSLMYGDSAGWGNNSNDEEE
jgi:exodeoxyribonuclease VIII